MNVQPIAVYLIRNHPLDLTDAETRFQWIGDTGALRRDLEDLIGPHDPAHVSVLVDDGPAGTEWERLLQALLDESVQMVITHLAPLTSAQRQQLIGICAQTGAQLITPSDAGRNRAES